MKTQSANKLTIKGDFQTFVQENIFNNQLHFSKMIPVPNKFKNCQISLDISVHDSDSIHFEYQLTDQGFVAKPVEKKVIINNEWGPNSFYWWCRKNWGCAEDFADVNLQSIEGGVVLWFLTTECCPDEWVYKLNEFYPDLDFTHESLTVEGIYGCRYTQDGEIIPGGVWDLSGNFLNKMNCVIKF